MWCGVWCGVWCVVCGVVWYGCGVVWYGCGVVCGMGVVWCGAGISLLEYCVRPRMIHTTNIYLILSWFLCRLATSVRIPPI